MSTAAPPPPTSTEAVTRNSHQVDSESDDDCLRVTEESDQASSSQISYRKMMKRTKVKDTASGSKDKNPMEKKSTRRPDSLSPMLKKKQRVCSFLRRRAASQRQSRLKRTSRARTFPRRRTKKVRAKYNLILHLVQ